MTKEADLVRRYQPVDDFPSQESEPIVIVR